jgi:hypothetical protein
MYERRERMKRERDVLNWSFPLPFLWAGSGEKLISRVHAVTKSRVWFRPLLSQPKLKLSCKPIDVLYI